MSGTTGQCKACSHAEGRAINEALVRGVPTVDVARQFKLKLGVIARHKRYHVPRVLALDKAGRDNVEAASLRKMLVEIGEDFQKLFKQFMDAKDFRAALIAKEKLLNWWQVAAKMLGIDQPPEGQREPQSPESLAQAVRDIYGLGPQDMPVLDTDQRALPPALPPAPVVAKEPEVRSENPTPEPKAAPEPEPKPDGDWEIKHEPDIAERVRRAVPVSEYAKRLDQIHAHGQRAEPGELSPRNLGEQVDLSAAEQKAPPPRVLGSELGCPACTWHGPGGGYREHWKATHDKPN
jgi:hypothetical protein